LSVAEGVAVHRGRGERRVRSRPRGRHPPAAAPLGCLLLAAGQISYATGDILYFIIGEGTPVDVCYLGMYVFLIIALIAPDPAARR
jgi:hypothetical protein